MKALYITHQFGKLEEIHLPIVERPKPSLEANECLVQIKASAVNQSDAKALLGFFDHSKCPRIIGRDFSGVIVEGPHKGKKIWGTGGSAGINFDGAQAEWMALSSDAFAEMPNNLSFEVASSQTLPFMTAYYGLVERANIQSKERVLVIGALGQIGQAAMSICQWKGCHPIALVRENSLQAAQEMGWEATSTIPDGIDVVFNPLANLFWEDLFPKIKPWGRIVIVGLTAKRAASFDLLPFYRANLSILGINTVPFGYIESAKRLNSMKKAFESRELRPIEKIKVFSMDEATEAYKAVLNSADERIVIVISR